jgi:TPR repeat protein
VNWYRRAVEQGCAGSQNNLGLCYYYGHGVPQDYTEAVNWYKKAAEQGCAGAQNNLGVCYCNGEGTIRNISEAKKLWEQVLESNDSEAIEVAKNNLEVLKTGTGEIKTVSTSGITTDFNGIFK